MAISPTLRCGPAPQIIIKNYCGDYGDSNNSREVIGRNKRDFE